MEYVINNYTFESGIRKLKQKIFEIVREINLKYFMNNYKDELPITVSVELVKDIFSNKTKILQKKISEKNHIGIVNGLYTTSHGRGGLTIIQTFKTPSDTKLSLMITGQQGDVMKESVKCAKTIVGNVFC